MMGVSFQPGASAIGQSKPQGGTQTGGGVQEAIKVLSLRLPRVVGAQAIAPQGLLNSPGSGGSRVDSVVNQVLAKYFPTGGQPAQSVGMEPSFDPHQGAQQPAFTAQTPYSSPFGTGQHREEPAASIYGTPHVIFDSPFGYGDLMTDASGRPMTKRSPFPLGNLDGSSQPPSMIEMVQPWWTPPSPGGPTDDRSPERI